MIRQIFVMLTVASFVLAQAQTPELPDSLELESAPMSLLERIEAGEIEVGDPLVDYRPVPVVYFMPAVFDTYKFFQEPDTFLLTPSGRPELRWAEAEANVNNRMERVLQRYMFENPQSVKYNLATLPEAPKHYEAVVDPTTLTIEVREIKITPEEMTIEAPELQRKNWLHEFNGSVQFSQAYISPNWYQGGNNNLNMIANAVWKVKLNQKAHPKLLFETTVQYKLGLNSAPNDSLRNYSISEDLFQVNTTFGVKALKKWYYSVTGMFKTQLFNSYTPNTRTMRASLLSPGELNIGVGMTYNHKSANGKLTFDANLAPISWNMRTCISDKMDPTAFDIRPGHKVANKIGSSVECKLKWQLAYNIVYNTRLFMFTDYQYIQADWEHTLSFDINRFLSTQVYVHMRYDTTTHGIVDSRWHKLQVKEILSFGFAYKFSSL